MCGDCGCDTVVGIGCEVVLLQIGGECRTRSFTVVEPGRGNWEKQRLSARNPAVSAVLGKGVGFEFALTGLTETTRWRIVDIWPPEGEA